MNNINFKFLMQGPYRLNPALYPSNVVVPSKGWFIYGGYFSNYQNNAQHLSSISSQWTLGPLLYLSQLDYGQCIVQVYFLIYKSILNHLCDNLPWKFNFSIFILIYYIYNKSK
jgi:hypothetical protein